MIPVSTATAVLDFDLSSSCCFIDFTQLKAEDEDDKTDLFDVSVRINSYI